MGAEARWCLLLCLVLLGAADLAERQWRAVDVVLDCFLVKDGGHHSAFASNGNMVKALLVLRQVPVLDDGSLEGFADFQLDTLSKDDPPVTFEASAKLIQIPQAEALLHADCSEEKVTCELSHYDLQTKQDATAERATWFITNVQVSGGGPGVSMVLKTLGDAENGAILHPTLNLPLSPQGTVQTSVEFQVTTQTPSLKGLLGSSTSLHCGFSMAPGLDLLSVEWRWQHKGSGQGVYRWAMGQGQARREGATLDAEQLLVAGDASLTLPSLTVKDEGSYICLVTTSMYQAQQIIQLNVQASPKVRLSQASNALPPTLICQVVGYYPLDMAVTWTRKEQGGAPVQVPKASLSSLRQSPAGTYSISSSLTAEPGSSGASYTCQVTHNLPGGAPQGQHLGCPASPGFVFPRMQPGKSPHCTPTPDTPCERRVTFSAFGVLIASALFVLTLWFLGLHRR